MPAGAERRRRRLAVMALVAAIVVVVDQVTKTLAADRLATHSVHVIGPFRLELAYNSGVAFSLGSGLTLPIILIAVVLVVVIVWFARGVPSIPAAIAVGLIVGGAIGNLADRLFRGHHGAVIDFVYSGFWPTFNVADSCIVIGSFILAVTLWQAGRHHQGAAATESSEPASS